MLPYLVPSALFGLSKKMTLSVRRSWGIGMIHSGIRRNTKFFAGCILHDPYRYAHVRWTRPTDTRYRIEPVCTSRECLKRRSLFRHARLCSRLRGQVFRMCCCASFQKLALPYAAWSAVGNRTQLVQSGRDRFCANSTADYLIFFHGRTQGTTVPALLCSE